MLPAEIDPFADHHIATLNRIYDDMSELLTVQKDDEIEIDRSSLDDWMSQIHNASNALTRFKVCMTDEVRQKQRLREQHHDCLKNHRMK